MMGRFTAEDTPEDQSWSRKASACIAPAHRFVRETSIFGRERYRGSPFLCLDRHFEPERCQRTIGAYERHADEV